MSLKAPVVQKVGKSTNNQDDNSLCKTKGNFLFYFFSEGRGQIQS